MRKNPYKKIWIIGIIIIFIGTSILPGINGKINYNDIFKKNNQDTSTVTLYAIEETTTKENKIEISTDDANIILNKFTELKDEITLDPYSAKAQEIRNDFVNLLDQQGMLPKSVTKNKFISLLTPPNLNEPKNNKIYNLKKTMNNFLFNRIIKILNKKYYNFDPPVEPYEISATLNFCTIASYGDGYTIPVMIPPRPRIGIIWDSSSSETYAGEVFSNKAIYATGAQSGSTVGFTGGGGTFAFPGAKFYVVVGYTWHVTINADHMDFFPPNQPPVISDENPKDGEEDVPLSLSELSFRISDPEGEPMDYTVTTEPNIGADSGNNKGNGVYKVPVSGLEYDKMYTWNIELSDGNFLINKKFTFFTPIIPFDPFNEGWHYRKKITIDHNKITGNLVNFPVLISIVDSDLKNKAQDDFDDILFMDNVGVASKLFHEIEKYDSSTGELVAWVKIPNLPSNVDTNIWMYYNNPDASNQEHIDNTWDDNFLVVYHMNDVDEGLTDSTSNCNDAIEDASDPLESDDYLQEGKIGYAVRYQGQGDDGDSENHVIPKVLDNAGWEAGFSLEVWFKPASDDLSNYEVLDFYDFSYVSLNMKNDGGGVKPRLLTRDDGNTNDNLYNTNNIIIGDWYYHVGTYNGNDKYTYINGGDKQHSIETSIDTMAHTNNIGANYLDNWGMDGGLIDEIRISNVERSSSWIATSYNTMNDPLTFFSIGPEESSP